MVEQFMKYYDMFCELCNRVLLKILRLDKKKM